MRSPNLALRGGTYYWRKKITVAGAQMTLSLPLATGNLTPARTIAKRLGKSAEHLRVAYDQSPGIKPDALRKTFNDALRALIQRFWTDTGGSKALPHPQASADIINAEAVAFLTRSGFEAPWTLEEDKRLTNKGWRLADAKSVGFAVFDYQVMNAVTKTERNSLVKTSCTSGPADLIDRILQSVRAEAYQAAVNLLVGKNCNADWIQAALSSTAADAFIQTDTANRAVPRSPSKGSLGPIERLWPAPIQNHTPIAGSGAKLRLLDAMDECIARHEEVGAWTVASVEQVRTALRMFDHACGGDIRIEDLEQRHVAAFKALCRNLPNRWGRTKQERSGGIAASLARAQTMAQGDLGLGQATINKHITWVVAVLNFAAGDDAERCHRPPQPLSFTIARAGIGQKARNRKKRDRDKRANWTKGEIAKLLSAPIWTGAAGIDARLEPGTAIIHDAWYWLPLMLILYGGRSSELAGLAMTDVVECDEIPYIKIQYTEYRRLKTVQSVRRLPIHPELIRLGFLDYVTKIRAAGCEMLFPEMASPNSKSFASTVYKSIFYKWRKWAFPDGTEWRHKVGAAWKDKDVHSFRGTATSMLKGKVEDSVRGDIFGHEGATETARTYDDEAELSVKLEALAHLTPLTTKVQPSLPVRIRPADRLNHGRCSTVKSRLCE